MKSYNPKSLSIKALELLRPYALSLALGLGIASYSACDDTPSDGDGDTDIDSDIDGDSDSDGDVQNVLTPVGAGNVRYADGAEITSQDVRRDEEGNDYMNITRTSPDVDPASGVNSDEVVVRSDVERCIDDVCIEVGSVVAEPGDTSDNRMDVSSLSDGTNIRINYTFAALNRNTLEPLENGTQSYTANATFNAGLDRVRITGCYVTSANIGVSLSTMTTAQDPADSSGRSLIGNYTIIDSTGDFDIDILGGLHVPGRMVADSDVGFHSVTFTASNGSQTSDPFTCEFYIDNLRSTVEMIVEGCPDERYNGRHVFLLPEAHVLELAVYERVPKDGGERVQCWEGFNPDLLPEPGESYIGDGVPECVVSFFRELGVEEQAIHEFYGPLTPGEVATACGDQVYSSTIEFDNASH